MANAGKYVWVRARTLHASGPSSWNYFEKFQEPYESDKNLEERVAEEYFEEFGSSSEYSRGSEAEIYDPSLSILQEQLKLINREINSLSSKKSRIKRMIHNVDTPTD